VQAKQMPDEWLVCWGSGIRPQLGLPPGA